MMLCLVVLFAVFILASTEDEHFVQTNLTKTSTTPITLGDNDRTIPNNQDPSTTMPSSRDSLTTSPNRRVFSATTPKSCGSSTNAETSLDSCATSPTSPYYSTTTAASPDSSTAMPASPVSYTTTSFSVESFEITTSDSGDEYDDSSFDDIISLMDNWTACHSGMDCAFQSDSADLSESDENTATILILYVTAFDCDALRCYRDHGEGSCHCDEDCFAFQDCCYNVLEKMIHAPENTNKSISLILESAKDEIRHKTIIYDLMTCVLDARNASGFWMVNKCPVTGNVDANEKLKCEADINVYSYPNIPIDQINEDRYIQTFKNIHCARCHGVNTSLLRYWNASIHCDNTVNTVITEETHVEEILKYCAITLYSDFKHNMRSCSGLFEDIPRLNNATDDSTSAKHSLCISYIMPVQMDENKTASPKRWFRNPHCASLQGFDGLNCKQRTSDCTPGGGSDDKGNVNLKVFFDINPIDGSIVRAEHCTDQGITCGRFEIYDCGTLRCRQLYCPSGQVPLDGHCVVGNGFPLEKEMVATKPTDQSNLSHKGVYIFELESDNGITFELGLREAIDMVISDMIDPSMVGEIIELESGQCSSSCVLVKLGDLSHFAFSNSIFMFFLKEYLKEYIEKKENVISHNNPGRPIIDYENPFQLKVRNFAKTDLIKCNDKHTDVVITRNVSFNLQDSSVDLFDFNMTLTLNETKWEYFVSNASEVTFGVVITCLYKDPSSVLNCSMVAYNLSEVKIEDNVLTIRYNGEEKKNGRFYKYGENIFVCSEDVLISFEYIDIYKYLDTYTNLTYVTSGISILASGILLLFHIINKKSRNMHGLNICALSIVILLTHAVILAQPFTKETTVCKVFGVLSYFLLVDLFIWMNIIGIEMARIFGGTKILSNRYAKTRFSRYVIISFIISLVIVSISLVFEFIPVETKVKPFYGLNGVCWITNGQAILAFVIIPVAVAIVFNIVVYGVILMSICRQRHAAKVLTKTGNKAYFVVFLKLSIILGLSWLVGIVAAFVDQEWLWYIHISLNGLQGLSLLVCSVVNRRVVRQMKSSLQLSTLVSSSTGHGASNGNIRN